MKNGIKGFIMGVILTAAITMIPAVADSLSKSINVLVDYANVAIDGESYDIPNFVYEGTTYVGLRAVGDLFGYDVDWDDETQVALFTTKGKEKIWPAKLAEKTSVVIDGEEIDEASVTELYNVFKANYPDAKPAEIKSAVVNELSVRTFLTRKAQEFGISVEEGEAEVAYKEAVAAYGDELTELLKQNGLTEDEFHEDFISTYEYNALAQSVIMHYVKSDVSDEIVEIKEKARLDYDANADNMEKEVVNVKHILIPTKDDDGNPLSDAKIKEAKNLVNEIYAKLNRGESFEEMLVKHNNDPGLTDEGYDVSIGSGFVEEFEKAALALEKNQISPVVETEYGFHIIKAYSRETVVTDFDSYFESNYLDECTNAVNDIYNQWIENAEIKAEWSF